MALIAQLIRRGVEVRLIHAKESGQNFREDFDKYAVLYDRLERALCSRVHFKILVFDGKEVYIGSTNLTNCVNAEIIVQAQSHNFYNIKHFSLTSATSWQGALFSLYQKSYNYR